MARTGSWMGAAAARAGQRLTGEPQPFYLRGISALLRAPTSAGDLYLKAVFPPFQAEPAITRWLSDHHPTTVPRVLATEPEEGWLLMADAGGTLIGELPDPERPTALAAGARAIVDIQRSVGSGVETLLGLGAPRRPLAEIPGLIDAALGPEGLSIQGETIDADRRQRAVEATAVSVARVVGLGFPDTVVHGDFHPGNAMLTDGRVVIIDWSDAAVGNPLVDLATWIAWSEDRPDEVEVAVDAWVDAWSAQVDANDLRNRIDDIELIGAAYQVISYDGIIRALEPSTRYTMGTGGGSWLKTIERVLARPR
jgi:aminoglycoside/choline kinase family phosphotransferase